MNTATLTELIEEPVRNRQRNPLNHWLKHRKPLDEEPELETIPITKHYYNDGTGFCNPVNTSGIMAGLRPSIDLDNPLNTRNSLCPIDESTSLYGNMNSAILHEEIFHPVPASGLQLKQYVKEVRERMNATIDYHHHDNFFTKPDNEGNEGFGGYMNLNVGGKSVNKQTMNFGYQDMLSITLQEKHDLINNSNWLTQSKQSLTQENYVQSLLNNFNKSNNFNPDWIKNNNLLNWTGK